MIGDEVLELVLEVVADGSFEPPTADATFDELDVDSLVLSEIAAAVGGRFEVEVREDELAAAGTPRACAVLLTARLAGATGAATESDPGVAEDSGRASGSTVHRA